MTDKRRRWLTRGAGIVALLVVIWVVGAAANEVWMDLVDQSLIAAMGAVALDLVLGHTGMASIGNAAFMAVGALCTAELALYAHVPLLLACLGGGLGAALVGAVVAIPALRIRGLYLAASTLAVQFIVVWIMEQSENAQLGVSGAGYLLPIMNVFGYTMATPAQWYPMLIVIVVVIMLLVRALLLSKPGRAWHAIRENESVARLSGLSVRNYKIGVSAISAFLIGIGGSLLACYIGTVDYNTYTLSLAITALSMVIVGGMGTIYGALIGAFVMTVIGHLIQSAASSLNLNTGNTAVWSSLAQAAIIGLVIVVVIMIEPGGLVRMAENCWKYLGPKLQWFSRRDGQLLPQGADGGIAEIPAKPVKERL
jgi:branched-chain amino acid transport system permease protein